MLTTQFLSVDEDGTRRAGEILRDGGLVAFATETVYGLGADARNDEAVAKIYAAKGRPSFNPLIVHVPDIDAARALVEFNDIADQLASAFWPGPLTLVLPLRADSPISKLVTAGLDTLAVRVPATPSAQRLLREAACPVAAPSANPSGRISATTSAHVLGGLDGRIDAVLDAGPCSVGLESTIIAVLPNSGGATLLRPGGLAREQIEALIGPVHSADTDTKDTQNAPTSPGQLLSHYAPKESVRLNAAEKREGELLLGFGPTADADLNLSESGNLLEAASNLFSMLHALDAIGRPIAVVSIPDTGLGQAINDRLRRAAAPRQRPAI